MSRAATTMAGVIAAHSADTFELAPFLSFPLMPPVTARPPLAKGKVRLVGDIVAVIVAETLAQAVDAAEVVVVDIDPLPAIIDPEAARDRGCAPAVRGARVERGVRDRDRPRGRRPARGRCPRIGMPDGQPASGRRAHGDQRLCRDPRRRRPAHRVDPESEPGRRPRRARRPARHGGEQPPRRGTDGRRWLRPQGRSLHRARPHRRARPRHRTAGQVDRRPQREHGVDGPRPRDGHEHPDRHRRRRHVRRARRRRCRRGRRVPGRSVPSSPCSRR